MPTARENSSIVKAPVLFRLPHLQHAAIHAAVATDPVTSKELPAGVASVASHAGQPQPLAAPIGSHEKLRSTWAAASDQPAGPTLQNLPPGQPQSADASQPQPVDADQPTSQPKRALALDDSFLTRWGFGLRRSVILLAAAGIIWGAWMMGQKSAHTPTESNLADQSTPSPMVTPPTSESITAVQTPDSDADLVSNLSVETQSPSIMEPPVVSSAATAAGFQPVAEPVAAPPRPALDTTASDSGNLASNSLDPPANGDFYSDDDWSDLEPSLAQKPAMVDESATTEAASDSDELAIADTLTLNQAGSPADETTATTEPTHFVPSSTPAMPGFDPNKIGSTVGESSQPRPTLSATPNGIVDWSRYLPGAQPVGAVRAVSATVPQGESASAPQAADRQAIYFEQNDSATPGVGVAPFYR